MDDLRTYLPPEWNNEERMSVLMSYTPPHHDVVARNARMTFWTAAIHHWCRTMKKLTFNLEESLSAFRRGTQYPLSLPDVLLHMNSSNDVVPLNELPLGERNEESWVGWGGRVFISRPSHFAWKKVKEVLGANNLQRIVFVNVKLLQELCDSVLTSFWESSSDPHSKNAPLSVALLYHKVGKCIGSADNLHLVIETLAYNGKAATSIHNDTTYVKFSMPGDTKKPVITQIEIAEEELQFTQKEIEANITKLSTDISSLQQEVMSTLKTKSKTQALSVLRRKKRCEKSLAVQMGALENVTTCLLQIQETQINKQVLGTFRTGVEAIRASIAGDHSADSAATTMDDLQQVLEECQDISSLLATGVGPQGADIDDSTLTEELDQLVLEDHDLNRIDQNLPDNMRGLELPAVPKNNPIAYLEDISSPVLTPP